MIRYIIKRILQFIPIIIAVAILVFLLMELIPGDVATTVLGETATEEQIEEFRELNGLNKPVLVRLGNYLYNTFIKFDFGKSYISGADVKAELLRRFPYTFKLALYSMLLTMVLGIPIGIWCAVKADRLFDRVSMFVTLLLNSMPVFWLALLLVLLFALKLGWLPSYGAEGFKYYILPVVANSVGSLAALARQTRSSMLEVINADYVDTARAKGVTKNAAVWKHALPNALIPIITICGNRFGFLLGGSVVVEMIFSIPGIGAYVISGINYRDYNIVMGGVVFIAIVFSAVMLATDIIYAFVDPRIKAQYTKGKTRKTKPKSDCAAT